jgi:hypothetical protein
VRETAKWTMNVRVGGLGVILERFEVSTTLPLGTVNFSNMTPCRWICVRRRVQGMYCFCLRGLRAATNVNSRNKTSSPRGLDPQMSHSWQNNHPSLHFYICVLMSTLGDIFPLYIAYNYGVMFTVIRNPPILATFVSNRPIYTGGRLPEYT